MLWPARSLLLALLIFSAGLARAGDLTVEVLDVGQGDSILIRTPAGKVVLIDAGDAPGEVLRLLGARQVDRLDLVVATHPHADHIGGLREVVGALPTKVFTDSGLPHTTATYRQLMEAVERRGVPYRTALVGQVYRLDDGATLEVLFPEEEPIRHTRSDLNSNSVVVRLRHQGHCFLFVGDAEAQTEAILVDNGLNRCDVLKVAHHGSDHSSTVPFLQAVRPRIAVISVGASNGYGHPAAGTLQRLQAVGAEVHRTDLQGTIVLTSSERGLQVSTRREEPAAVATSAAARPQARARGVESVETPARALPGGMCKFVASAASQVFHEPTCRNALRIKASNRRCYSTKGAALEHAKRPAKCCHP